VLSGLVMCGADVVPALVERVLDRARPVSTRTFAAYALTQCHAPEGWSAMVEVLARGEVAMLPSLGGLLEKGGEPAAEVAMAAAERDDLPPEVRLTLAGLAVRAAGVEWARDRASQLAIAMYPQAPAASLALMRMVPSPAYRAVIEARPELVRANAKAALDVLLASAPEEEEGRAVAGAVGLALQRFLEDVAPEG